MAIVGSAQVLIRPTFSGFQKEVRKVVQDELGNPIGQEAGKTAGKSLGESLSTWGKRGAAVAGGAIAAVTGAALVKGFGRLSAIENAQAKMRGLGHDADAVRQIMDNAMTSVKGTAFGLGEAATIAASAVAAGITPGEKLATHLTRVANNAAAAGISMEEMGSVFNKAATQANGVQNDVISQLADKGIPIYQALAEEMGVTAGEVFKLASEGKVNFETFSTAAEKAAGTVASEMGGTVTGAWQNMWASIGRVGANALSGVFPQVAPALQGVMNALGPVEEKAKVVGEAVGKWLARGAEGVKTFIAEWKSGEGLGGQVAEWIGRIKDGAQGLFDLLVRGDYTGALRNAFGWEEDSGTVDVLFRLRDAVVDLGGWIKDTLVPAAKDFGGWLKDHKGVVAGIVAAYIGLRGVMAAHTAAMAVQKAGGFVAWLGKYLSTTKLIQGATKAWAAVQWLLNAAMSANPIGLIIVGLVALAAGLVIAYKKSETFRNIVNGAWEGIKNIAAGVVDWLNTSALPVLTAVWDGIKAGWDGLVAGISWAWENILKPAWDAVVAAGQWIWGVLSPIFSGIWTAWSTMAKFIFDVWVNVLKFAWDAIAFAANWLWNTVLKPVFGWIQVGWQVLMMGIKLYWENVLKPVWNAISAAASWLWTNALKPAFDGIKRAWEGAITGIKWVWDNVLKPVFNTVAGFVTDTVVPGFQKGVDTVKGIWDTLKAKLAEPINWVLENVWDGGIKKAFDSVAEAIGSDARLPKAPRIDTGGGGRNRGAGGRIPAFAKGGLHRGGWALVGEEGPELINTSRPGRIYTAAETAAALAAGRDLSPALSRAAAGRSPREALAPMGDNIATRAVEWIRGGLASAAGLLLDPMKNLISSTVGQWGQIGGLAGSAVTSSIDRLLSWIRGKDDEAPALTSAGGWVRPSAGPITSRFGPRWGGMHAGIDIAGGGRTYAAAGGRVFRTGGGILGGRTGLGIGLDHGGGVFTYYGHNPVGGIQVRPGQTVKAGQHIGYQGATGNVTGTHLHFELHKGGWGRAVDPQSLGVFDQGGFLAPGALGTNLTRRPEPVLTGQQWADIHTLAQRGAAVTGGVTFNGPITTVDVDELARRVVTRQRDALAANGLIGGYAG